MLTITARIKQITHKLDPNTGNNLTLTLVAYVQPEDLADLAQLTLDKVDVDLTTHQPIPTHQGVDDLPIFRPLTRSVE